MRPKELVAISDQLLDAAKVAGKPAVLICQYDIQRDENVFRWSCDDRSIGFRRHGINELSQQDLRELVRTWRESEYALGSTADTAQKAMQFGPETKVLRANWPE